MKLYAYWMLAYGSLKEALVYWKNSLMAILLCIFRIVIQISAWYALYRSVDFAPVMGRSFEVMMTYQLVVLVVQQFVNPFRVSEDLEERMKSGEIAMDFLRPAAPRGILVAKSWGTKIFFLVPLLLAVAVVVAALGGILLPSSPGMVGLFIVSLIFGYLIHLFFDLLMAGFAFWFVSVGTLSWFVDFFQLAMSGAIVPLWLLPDWLQTAARLLPFQAGVYIPMQIYLGEVSWNEAFLSLGFQLVWILILFLLSQWLWKKGVRQIVVHGG